MNKDFQTKKDYIEIFMQLTEPLKKYYSEGKALLDIGYTATHYSDIAIGLEGFSRVLWGLVPLISGGAACNELRELYIEGIRNGTNPDHSEYWGQTYGIDQKYVEMAVMGLGLAITPEFLWEPLTDIEKKNFNHWLLQINKEPYSQNNWLYFRIFVNVGLKLAGGEYSEAAIEKSFETIEECYLSDGWYTDGKNPQLDYYIPFAMHYYSLLYAKIMKDKDPVRSGIFIERAKLFAKEFIYWFSQDGDALPFGRSLTYRFAQGCFWGALAYADVEVFSWGVMKGIVNRHFRNWFDKPILNNENILTLGYAYPNLNFCEGYNAPGSPYWAFKSFIILALPEEHPYWQAEEEELPDLSEIKLLKHPKMLMDRREKGNIVALTSGQYANFLPAHVAEKYAKFAYSSYFGFNVPKSYYTLAQAAPDNMLAFIKDDICFVRRRCEEVTIFENKIYSKWSPLEGILVETELFLCEKGHIRKHRITADFDCAAAECGFSLPVDDFYSAYKETQNSKALIKNDFGMSRITLKKGDGIGKVILCEANTNLLHKRTALAYIELAVKKGVSEIEVEITGTREISNQ